VKPGRHIKRLLRECYRIQGHGHCRDAADFVRIGEIEKAVQDLAENFENKELMENKRRWLWIFRR